jgi:hypothetical protein
MTNRASLSEQRTRPPAGDDRILEELKAETETGNRELPTLATDAEAAVAWLVQYAATVAEQRR